MPETGGILFVVENALPARKKLEMRSSFVARVRDRTPMEVADDLTHRFW
jgi:hypothetical protein